MESTGSLAREDGRRHGPAGGQILHILLIMMLGYLAYSNTFGVPFQFDDSILITENPIIKDFAYFKDTSKVDALNLGILREQLTTRYLVFLSFWANHAIGALNPTGYHIVNMAFHLVNAVLVYFVVRLTFSTPRLSQSSIRKRSPYIALVTGILFVSHPLQTESITYIAQRSGELSAFFFLLSTAAYIKSRLPHTKKSVRLYIVSIVSAVLAMKCKENAFTLPIVLTLYEFLCFTGGRKRRFALLAPLILTMIIIPADHLRMETGTDGGVSILRAATLDSETPRAAYFFTQFRVITTYIRLLVFPVNQNIDYDYPLHSSLMDIRVLMSMLFIFSLIALCIWTILYSRRKSPDSLLVALGGLWFFITLSVESSVIPIPMLINEYRVYLPSVGAFLAFSSAVFFALDRLGNKAQKAGIILVLLLLPPVLAAATHERNSIWTSRISLWEDTAKKSPLKARPHNNLGTAYMEAGMDEKALIELWTTVNIDPDFFEAYANLGSIYEKKGLQNKVIEIYEYSLLLNPDFVEGYNKLGLLYGRLGDNEKAMDYFLQAVARNPGYAEAHLNLAIAYQSLGMAQNAIKHYEIALRLAPGEASAYNNLGLLYQSMKLEGKARQYFTKAIAIDPEYAEAHNNLGLLYFSLGYTGQAEESLLQAIDLNPDLPEAQFNLGIIYMQKGFYEAAKRKFQKTLELRPDDEQATELLKEVEEKLD